MAIDDKFRNEKLQYGSNWETAKAWAPSSNKIDKYEYLAGQEILPFKKWISFLFYHLKIFTDRTTHARYYFPKVEIKEYNTMIDGRDFSDQPLNKIATSQGGDYTTLMLIKNQTNKLILLEI